MQEVLREVPQANQVHEYLWGFYWVITGYFLGTYWVFTGYLLDIYWVFTTRIRLKKYHEFELARQQRVGSEDIKK